MQTSLRVIHNALPFELLAAIKEHIATQEYVRTNHTSWQASVVNLSGPIYMADISEQLHFDIKSNLNKLVPEFELMNFEANIYVSMGGRYSYIPWHTDSNYAYAATIYLNEHWDREWAGYFMYETEDGRLEAVAPEFNKAIILKPPVQHCVTMPNVHAPVRYAIQVFFKQKAQE